MANSPNEPPAGAVPPTIEEAERLAERFRPSWEVDEPPPAAEAVAPLPPGVAAGRAHTPPPPALVASPPPLAVRPMAVPASDASLPSEAATLQDRSRRNQTLVGIQPTETASRSSPAAARSELSKATLVGIGIPEPVVPHARVRTNESKNPLEEVFDVSDVESPASPEVYAAPAQSAPQPPPPEALAPPPSPPEPLAASPSASAEPAQSEHPSPKPTGVAKIYHPKDGPNTPAVVVAPSALATAPAPQPRRRARSQQTPTIPGTLRALQSPGATDIETDEFAPRRSRLPLVVGVSLLLGVGAALAVFSLIGEKDAPPASVIREPPAEPRTPPALPEPAKAEIPAPPDVTPGEVAADAAPTPPSTTASRTPAAREPKVKEASRRPAPAATPVRKPPPKKAPTAGAPAKSKAVIVRDSPF